MRAAVVTTHGVLEALEPVELPDPAPGDGEVVVRVRAASVNPTDLAARQGFLPKGGRPPYVLGWDLSGEVASVGEGVTDLAVGDPVAGMIPWYLLEGRVGAYAELAAVRAEWLTLRPENLDHTHAATIPLNALTAAQALDLLAPPPGGEILVTGASGGVGAFVVRLAVQAGHEVTAVAGAGDEEYVTSLGARRVLPRDVDYATIGRFAHVIDAVPVDAPVLDAVSDGGHVVATRPPTGDAPRDIRHEVVFVRPDTQRLTALVAAVAAGTLMTRVARTLPLHQAAEAHRAVEQDHPRGKVVLRP
jgi:NADPH:quinone reductase